MQKSRFRTDVSRLSDSDSDELQQAKAGSSSKLHEHGRIVPTDMVRAVD
jgi:hypothetical protein